MQQDCLYVFSNGGKKAFPHNSLTDFTNDFPTALEINKSYEIGIQAIGFPSKFRNVILPPKNVPSLIISNCNASEGLYENTDTTSFFEEAEGPVKWSFNEHNARTCMYEKRFFEIEGRTGALYLPDRCISQECFFGNFSLKDINYTDSDITDFCKEVNERTGIIATFKDRKISFEIDLEWVKRHKTKRCYLLMHDSFVLSFGFQTRLVRSYMAANHKISKMRSLIRVMLVGSIGNVEHFVRVTRRNGEKYIVFYIQYKPPDESSRLTEIISLTSNVIDLKQPQWPKTIKIVCSEIEPQIYNNNLAQNILVYTPDFHRLEDYTTQEIECVDYMPLLNTSLTKLSFKLLDERNRHIQLLPGVPTWLKLVLRSVPMFRKTFNTIVTSETSSLFEKNTQNTFKTRLPRPMNLENKWWVCLSSISHPSRFATFLPPEVGREIDQMKMERSIAFQEIIGNEMNTEMKYLEFKSEYAYDAEEIISEINKFLNTNHIGKCSYSKTLTIEFSKKCNLYIGETLSHVLGNATNFVEAKLRDANVSMITALPGSMTYTFPNKFNLSYMHPKYIMIYANIIKPVLVAGEYRKLLRIAPVHQTELDYVTTYFRHKEYCDLENTVLDGIEIIIASHDGRRIYFASQQNVVVNLEFSNYPINN